MRRALRLFALVLVLSCSEGKEHGETRQPSSTDSEPAPRDDEAQGDEGAADDEDDTQEDVAEDAEAATDSAAVGVDAGSEQTPTFDAGAHPDAAGLDATARTDAATSVEAGESADAAEAAPANGEAGADTGAPDAGAGVAEVPCIDEQIAQLILFDAPATGLITEEASEPGTFSTLIDATGGGLATTQSFVYARFSNGGLEKLAIGDEAAFASSSWHIAARRYVLRVNNGVSGPGTVRAARTAPGTTFENLSVVPDGLVYRSEQYYTESCEFVPDTSGVGAPATALSSFWSYAGCVKMTDNVFVLELPEQHHVKLQVIGYYPLDNQQRCNETDMIAVPSGAGNMRIRWAFLD